MPQYPYSQPTASSLAGASYDHIASAGTFVVKATPGNLFTLNINSATAGATLEFFDQATTVTGTVAIAGPITIGTADILPMRLGFGPENVGLKTNTGLVALTTGTLDVTVGFR